MVDNTVLYQAKKVQTLFLRTHRYSRSSPMCRYPTIRFIDQVREVASAGQPAVVVQGSINRALLRAQANA